VGNDGAGLLLLAGFAVPAVPCIRAMGTIVPQQLTSSTTNAPPVILRAGSRPAGSDPLELEVRPGELLEVPIEAFDPEDQPLTFAVVGIPTDCRPVYQFRSAATGCASGPARGRKEHVADRCCPRVGSTTARLLRLCSDRRRVTASSPLLVSSPAKHFHHQRRGSRRSS
jgi:hypothetical protein